LGDKADVVKRGAEPTLGMDDVRKMYEEFKKAGTVTGESGEQLVARLHELADDTHKAERGRVAQPAPASAGCA
jgi:hypothetical protein